MIKAETAPKKNLESAHLQKLFYGFGGGQRSHQQQQQQHFFRRRDRKPRNKKCLSAQIASNFCSQRSNEKLGFVEAHPGLKQFEPALKKINNASS